jgi:hypothetical protein
MVALSASSNHTIEVAWHRLRTVPDNFGVDSAPHEAGRVVSFFTIIMPKSVTIRDKEHWKDRLSALIDKRIDVLLTDNPQFMNKLTESAEKRAWKSLGIDEQMRSVRRLEDEERAARDKCEATYEAMHAKLLGKSSKETSARGFYTCQELCKQLIAKRRELHEEDLLAGSKLGREILMLRTERDNMLDTVCLATSGQQIKVLWEKVMMMLGDKQTDLQREALVITPTEEE